MAALTVTALVAGGTALLSDIVVSAVTFKTLEKEKHVMAENTAQNTQGTDPHDEINRVSHELQHKVMLEGMAAMLRKEGYSVHEPGSTIEQAKDKIAAAGTKIKDAAVATGEGIADGAKGIGYFFTGIARSMKEAADSVIEKGKK